MVTEPAERAHKDVAPYAVLFKIHYWDNSIARRITELQARCAAGELWVVVDDTNGYVEDVRHTRVFRTTEADMLRLGMPDYPKGRLNW